METGVILIRMVLSAFLGGLIGFERELHGCAAGLRTHILVCIGSTLFMLTSVMVGMSYSAVGDVDPSRIAAGVVTGIGFLGAGAIIRYGVSIRGLTTAASIWAVSALGLAVGAGIYFAATVAAMIILVILILSRLEDRMNLKRIRKDLSLELDAENDVEKDDVRILIESYGGRIKDIREVEEGPGGWNGYKVKMILARIHHRSVMEELGSLPGVIGVKWS